VSFILPSGTWKVNGGNSGRNWRTKIAKPAYNRTRVCGRCAEDRKYASIEDAFKRPCANARWLFCSILLLTCARFHAQSLFAGGGRSKKQILAGGFPGDHGGQLRQILIRVQPVMRFSGKGRPQDTCGRPSECPKSTRRGRCPHRPKGTIEFAGDFRKIGLYRRVDVGIDPYERPRKIFKRIVGADDPVRPWEVANSP